MASIPLSLINGSAYVYGQIAIDNVLLMPTLMFLIDTAASASFIAPDDETKLILRKPSLSRDFTRGVKHVHTMLGTAPVKALMDHGHQLDLVFEDINGDAVPIRINYLSFADDEQDVMPSWIRWLFRRSVSHIWNKAGKDLPHSILGQDVLRQMSHICIPKNEYGLLTTVNENHLVEHMEKPESLIAGLRAYYDRQRPTDIWYSEK